MIDTTIDLDRCKCGQRWVMNSDGRVTLPELRTGTAPTQGPAHESGQAGPENGEEVNVIKWWAIPNLGGDRIA